MGILGISGCWDFWSLLCICIVVGFWHVLISFGSLILLHYWIWVIGTLFLLLLWDLVFCEFGILVFEDVEVSGTLGLLTFSVYGGSDFGIWGYGDMGLWDFMCSFSILGFSGSWDLGFRDFGIQGIWICGCVF